MKKPDIKLPISDNSRIPKGYLDSLVWEEETGKYLLRIEAGNYCCFDKNLTNGLHWHQFHEFCLVLDGHGQFQHGEDIYGLNAGDLFLADPRVPHEISSYESRDLLLAYFMVVIKQSPLPVSGALEDRWVDQFIKDHDMHKSGQNRLARYLELFQEKHFESHHSWYFQSQHMRNLVLEMMIALTRSGTDSLPTPIEARSDIIQRAIEWIEDHIDQPIKVKDLAAAMHCSERTLRRLFHRHIGKGVLEVIHQRKMSHACIQLLMRFPVEAVAERCGMESPSHFSRFFKQHIGLSPKAYQSRYAPREGARQTTHV